MTIDDNATRTSTDEGNTWTEPVLIARQPREGPSGSDH